MSTQLLLPTVHTLQASILVQTYLCQQFTHRKLLVEYKTVAQFTLCKPLYEYKIVANSSHPHTHQQDINLDKKLQIDHLRQGRSTFVTLGPTAFPAHVAFEHYLRLSGCSFQFRT
jgi:hypothetical protein